MDVLKTVTLPTLIQAVANADLVEVFTYNLIDYITEEDKSLTFSLKTRGIVREQEITINRENFISCIQYRPSKIVVKYYNQFKEEDSISIGLGMFMDIV